MQLEGRVVLVTGAGTGIGQASAVALASRGARLVLAGRRLAALEATRGMVRRSEDATLVPADVTDAGDRRALCALLHDRFGRLDVLVNNAGVVETGEFAAMSDDASRLMVETNVLAPITLTRALLPLLRAGAPSRIVNVGSVFGDIAHPLFAVYSACKFGLRGFSDAMRRELAGSGVGVTYVAPRGTRTPAAEGFARLIAPLGMRLDPPERVARMIVRAIERDAASAYPFGPERLFVLVQRLAPRLIDSGIRRKTAPLLEPHRPDRVPARGEPGSA